MSSLFPKARPELPEKRELAVDEEEEIRFAFDTLDAERTGLVTPRQLKVALRALGFGVKKADVAVLLRKLGEDEGATMPFETFRAIVADMIRGRSSHDEARRAFQLFDVLESGRIELGGLRKVVRSLGVEISDDELSHMIREFGSEGGVNEAEFLAVMAAEE